MKYLQDSLLQRYGGTPPWKQTNCPWKPWWLEDDSLIHVLLKWSLFRENMWIFGQAQNLRQISIIPKPELRGFWGDSLTKPPFKVTSAEVVIICSDKMQLNTKGVFLKTSPWLAGKFLPWMSRCISYWKWTFLFFVFGGGSLGKGKKIDPNHQFWVRC